MAQTDLLIGGGANIYDWPDGATVRLEAGGPKPLSFRAEPPGGGRPFIRVNVKPGDVEEVGIGPGRWEVEVWGDGVATVTEAGSADAVSP